MNRTTKQTSNHVRNKVSVAGGVEEVDGLVFSFESGLSHIDRHPSTPLIFRLVEHPSIGEGRFTSLLAVLFKEKYKV